ncbi:NADP oxidoreductase [Arthrobacter sp. MYb211]|nr:NADP oxidoreductase [Arthrobacter sp. MYb229]PRA13234.1 NADP oxidoreductase [Arthrobacter sp. MYb221]PRB50566.1 NADP oxidoreductase [Arthrobacter sp. MYb216]PRC10429.1 NADP oxidoreductase [Arthrobacter sp. MYb211]
MALVNTLEGARLAPQATIGILGAGRVGTAIARLALAAGYRVKLATSKPAEENSLIIEIVTPGAEAVDASEAAAADLVIVAIPLHKFKDLDSHALSGKIVVDAMNYWSATDGEIPDFVNTALTSSEVVAAFLSASHVLKSFNHIGYHEMEPDALPAATGERRALAIAGDNSAAKTVLRGFIEHIGFDAVDAGDLAAGRHFEPGSEIFNGRFNASELNGLLHAVRLSN